MGKLAFIFPGQGAQWVGMGRDVAEASSRARAAIDRAGEVLGYDLAKICFDGPEEMLEATDVQQPAILAVSVAIYEALLESGFQASSIHAVAGLSLGEYTALHVTGSMDFDDTLRLVRTRGKLMQEAAEANPGGMVSVIGADAGVVQELCDRARGDGVLAPANYNCPGQIVISGDRDACQRAVDAAETLGCRAIALKVSGAFHSPLMQSAAEGLGHALRDTAISRPRIPVISNVDAQAHDEPDVIRRTLQRQVTQPVQWQRSIEAMIEDEFDTFVEVGPGRVLSGLMRKINRNVRAINVSDAEGLKKGIVQLAETAT